jgi:hypothetical protein
MARKPRETPREPHHDPRMELQLQRILSLQKMIRDKEDLISRDHEQVRLLRETVAKHPVWNGTEERQDQIVLLLAEIKDVEAEILTLHAEIESRAGDISDIDLAAL